MTNNDTQAFQIGSAVLADLGGAQIPGVIVANDGDRYLVQLSQPWTDETGQQSNTFALAADRLSLAIDQETGGQQALPS